MHTLTRLRSAVCNMSGNRCESDCRSILCVDSSWDGGVVNTFLGHFDLDIDFWSHFWVVRVWSISYITANFPQMCLMLDQFLCPLDNDMSL